MTTTNPNNGTAPKKPAPLDEQPSGLTALAAYKSGLFPAHVQEAQVVLDRAVTGGFFDDHEGGDVHLSISKIKDDARRLLYDQFGELDVHVVWDRIDKTTRILVAPHNPDAVPNPAEALVGPDVLEG